MEQVKPSILVALGEMASQAVLQGAVQAKRQQIHSFASVQAIASYHPVQAQSDPVQFKRPIWEDLKLAMAAVAK
jgi:uracil-DNA glycosylase